MTLTVLQIIKDLQLLGLVAALVVADVILLVTWVLTDPIQCLQILGVSMKVRGCQSLGNLIPYVDWLL